ncbi:putative Zn finger protein [Krasilnikovia cinnamomea]|uniref:Putative Zn finger protein n=1 Tax=Krasilnikovia cinnamomea TaxID=349313 RepID=A0A4Q7ZLK8_9ACTN|nr:SWIM zinc finger family protein [Krasilnikovia cinnamomea]RZU51491.1 putative Zn finger protein [Krasilnikovia cinnamomea]
MPVDPQGRFYEAAKPIEVDGGIAVRAKRGAIGERWWSRRFVDILEQICQPGRLARGRSYARKGQVMDFTLAAGQVTARVQGSRPEPYAVTITIGAYDDAEWGRVEDELRSRALYRAALLAGEMPHEIIDVFAELGLPLFPAALDLRCSCPDWAVPCKHASAVLYVLAEAFDDDPFGVLAWRGRSRDALLDALRGMPEPPPPPDQLAVVEEPLADRLTNFYSPGISLSRLRERPARVAAPPELLLRALDPPPIRVRHIPLLDLLRPAYRGLGGTPETRDQPAAGAPDQQGAAPTTRPGRGRRPSPKR